MKNRSGAIGAIRRFYAGLPLIRELRNLNLLLTEVSRGFASLDAELLKVTQHHAAEYESTLLRDPRYSDPKNLARFERHVFSQFGEDGIIAEIFRRIGETTRTFLEVGVGSGIENNTAYLLFQGWTGAWLEGNEESVREIRRRFARPIADGKLEIVETFVTAENIRSTIENLQLPREIDLFSLDVDRNTYWVWKSLSAFRPRVAVIEYNGHFPADIDWRVQYDARSSWNGSMHFGASLKALERLGDEMGYALVGCNTSGVNAFFVRRDLCGGHFEGPFTSEKHYEPFRQFLERKQGHRPCYDDLADR